MAATSPYIGVSVHATQGVPIGSDVSTDPGLQYATVDIGSSIGVNDHGRVTIHVDDDGSRRLIRALMKTRREAGWLVGFRELEGPDADR